MVVTRYPVLTSDPARLREAVDRWFGEPVFRTLSTTQRANGTFALPLDVFSTDSDVYIIASAPGLGPDDLEVTVDDNVVTLSGTVPNIAKSVEGEQATWFVHEIGHGAFKRTINLAVDVDVDAAEAKFENGILRLRLPKADVAKPRQIKVQAVTSGAEVSAEIPETTPAE